MMKIPKRTLKGPQRPSLDELVQKCWESLSNSDLQAARAFCDQVLSIEPKNLPGRILLARIQYRSKDIRGAKETLLSLTQEFPKSIEVWNDLCVVLSGSQSYLETKQILEPVLPLMGHPTQLAEHYVESLLALQDAQRACEYLSQQPQLMRNNATLKLLMSDALKSQARFQEAAEVIESQLTETPQDETLFRRLTSIWREARDLQKFEQALSRWLTVAPRNPVAQHLLASLSAHETEEYTRASDEYVKSVFDEFAENFDQSLAQLDYQAPQLIQSILQKLIQRGAIAASELKILDGGCGTGLCGPILHPLASSLVGVDLSRKMLDQAVARGVYTELIESELTEYLKSPPVQAPGINDFDLIVICDTLNYFGNLEAVLTYAHKALIRGGVLVFTIETLSIASSQGDYRPFLLGQHGRYLHDPKFIEQEMRRIGYTDVTLESCELRKQAGKAVAGTIIHGRRAH